MANLTPQSQFDDVYQLETSDPVEGGAGGKANQQAQELLNRTQWLADKVLPGSNTVVISAISNCTLVNTFERKYVQVGDVVYSTLAFVITAQAATELKIGVYEADGITNIRDLLYAIGINSPIPIGVVGETTTTYDPGKVVAKAKTDGVAFYYLDSSGQEIAFPAGENLNITITFVSVT